MFWVWTSSHPRENEPTVCLLMRDWACFVTVTVSSLWRLNVDHSDVVDPGWPLVMTAVMTVGSVVLSPWKGRCLWLHVGMTHRCFRVDSCSCWMTVVAKVVATAVERIATWKACDIWHCYNQQEIIGSMGYQLENDWETCCWTVRITEIGQEGSGM
jgi:hypothetical protein